MRKIITIKQLAEKLRDLDSPLGDFSDDICYDIHFPKEDDEAYYYLEKKSLGKDWLEEPFHDFIGILDIINYDYSKYIDE